MTHTGIILAVQQSNKQDIDLEIKELKELSESIGIEILGSHVQKRQTVERKSYVGSGFLSEVKEHSEEFEYRFVTDERLATSNRAIETILDTTVIDRTQVSLDIFSI